MINSSLFFLRQCESLDWSDCLVVLLLSATHFRKSGHARLIRGCFSFSQCFRAGVFCSLSPRPLPAPFDLPHLLLSSGSFNWRFRGQIARSKKIPALQANPTITPVAQAHRRIPFSVRPKLEAELEKLEADDVIERVEKPTSWVSPVVITPKRSSNEIRLNVDRGKQIKPFHEPTLSCLHLMIS